MRSRWESSDCGPPRRVYLLTDTGQLVLHDLEERLRDLQSLLGRYTLRHEALRSPAASVSIRRGRPSAPADIVNGHGDRIRPLARDTESRKQNGDQCGDQARRAQLNAVRRYLEALATNESTDAPSTATASRLTEIDKSLATADALTRLQLFQQPPGLALARVVDRSEPARARGRVRGQRRELQPPPRHHSCGMDRCGREARGPSGRRNRPDALGCGEALPAPRAPGGAADTAKSYSFVSDTRFVSHYVIQMDDAESVLLCSGSPTACGSRFDFANPTLDDGERRIPEQTLHVRLDRSVGDGVHEDYDVVNYGTDRVRFSLVITSSQPSAAGPT